MNEAGYWRCDVNFSEGLRYSLFVPSLSSRPRFEITPSEGGGRSLMRLVIDTEHGEVVARYNPHDEGFEISNSQKPIDANDLDKLVSVGSYLTESSNLDRDLLGDFRKIVDLVGKNYGLAQVGRNEDVPAGN